MITWDQMIYFSLPTILLLLVGAWFSYREKRVGAILFTLLGLALFATYIGLMWASLERPPMRTMGETRLWYSFFAILAGLLVYLRWRYRWILGFSTVLSTVFILINLLKPEIHNKTMMPALESIYFVPHVVSYMFSYAMLGVGLLIAIYVAIKQSELPREKVLKLMSGSDNMVYIGLSFLMIGLLLGAIWAKEAWGHYWSWDPKETWAAITMLAYLIYIHYRLQKPLHVKRAIIFLVLAFLCLQICWYGVNYLPSAKGISIHTYG